MASECAGSRAGREPCSRAGRRWRARVERGSLRQTRERGRPRAGSLPSPVRDLGSAILDCPLRPALVRLYGLPADWATKPAVSAVGSQESCGIAPPGAGLVAGLEACTRREQRAGDRDLGLAARDLAFGRCRVHAALSTMTRLASRPAPRAGRSATLLRARHARVVLTRVFALELRVSVGHARKRRASDALRPRFSPRRDGCGGLPVTRASTRRDLTRVDRG